PETRDRILTKLAEIRELLPFLQDIPSEKRQTMPKMGDKSQAFVTKALEIATQNSSFLPRSFDLDKMKSNLDLYSQLYGISAAIAQLDALVDATEIAIGSEVYTDALTIYRYAKSSGLGASLEPLMKDMEQRFARSNKKEKGKASEAEKAPEPDAEQDD
ncbi:MAG: hypothetical protein MUF49_26685, partial [Oculatellaceae cyanobacterium Prado106]|nr:hypothetical protein [Oculatellaceae cyanobacterium Prado106]